METRFEVRLASFRMSRLDRAPWKLEHHGGFVVIAINNEAGRNHEWVAGPFETRLEADAWVTEQRYGNAS